MKIIHNGIEYECAVAVKCSNDNYIKLFDSTGKEIAAFYNISDFSEYTITGGTFTDPCDCSLPMLLSCYVIAGRTIKSTDWILCDDGKYRIAIVNDLFSANVTTCNILLNFAKGTELEYVATQDPGQIVLCVDYEPRSEIVIENIQITRI